LPGVRRTILDVAGGLGERGGCREMDHFNGGKARWATANLWRLPVGFLKECVVETGGSFLFLLKFW